MKLFLLKHRFLVGLLIAFLWKFQADFQSYKRAKSIEVQFAEEVTNESSPTGENLWATLGGFRPLLASMIQLRVADAFAERDWSAVGDVYDQVTSLQPKVPAYWRTAGWILCVNGGMPKEDGYESFIEAQQRSRSFQRGAKVLERGLAHNPEDFWLNVQMASVHANRYLFPNPNVAAQYYKKASELAAKEGFTVTADKYQRHHLYALCRTGNEDAMRQAYGIAKELFNSSEQNHVPTLLSLLWVLQDRYEQEERKLSLVQVFRSEVYAERFLGRYLQTAEGFNYPIPEVE